jgi:CheY-like chemotaxis protein
MSDTQNPPQSEHDTIMVVEDEIMVRTAIAEYLRHCGYRVIEAASADEAIVMLTEAGVKIDLVFSDIEMPGSMDGFGLARWVRANKPAMHIILTGTLQKAAHAAGDLCEEGPHLAKPYEPSQLIDWIKRLRTSNT